MSPAAVRRRFRPVSGYVARPAEFTRRYLEVVQAVTASAVSATTEPARKAG
jgi:hypothetical protein